MKHIMNKTSNPILGYSNGKLKMKGSRDDIMRLQSF
jgi:hypothetical protein